MCRALERFAGGSFAPACLAAVALGAGSASAQSSCDVTEDAQCNAVDGAPGDNFGWSLDLSGNAVIIGAYGDDDAGESSGSAYVHRFDGSVWVEEQKLTASDAAADDWFGWTVAIQGNTAVVGSPRDGDGQFYGAAYVFEFDGANWGQTQKLTAADTGFLTGFGGAVDIDGGTLIVGAGDVFIGGSAYFCAFDGDTWVEDQKVTASDGVSGDGFGEAVALRGDVAIVGARWDDDRGEDSGSAYVFRFNGSDWVQEAKLVASDGGAGDQFGLRLAIDNDVAAVGALFHDGAGELSDTGAVYVFRYDGESWNEEAKLLPADIGPGDAFGVSVAIRGGTLLAGALDTVAATSGAVYVFDEAGGTWAQIGKLLPSDNEESFGHSVALDGQVTFVGADQATATQGSSYVFDSVPPQCVSCPWDLDEGGSVSTGDLLALLGAWGTSPGGPPDFNGDGTVGTADLLELLGNWGSCP